PVITALVAIGVLAAVILRRIPIARTALVLFVVWLVLYFGRPTLGGLVSLFPMHDGLLLHRFIGSVELFAIVLIGIGAGWAYERASLPLPAFIRRRAGFASSVRLSRSLRAATDRERDQGRDHRPREYPRAGRALPGERAEVQRSGPRSPALPRRRLSGHVQRRDRTPGVRRRRAPRLHIRARAAEPHRRRR